ncbi:unnamed protein product [Effrenium voratum]|uniref:Uncharacterized protein n=1 Tax=Effrenium voratum TaxID=2562239 RepID=A0AA36MHP3_9DINO|nr:unnamed protein product [Effrenium voratum]
MASEGLGALSAQQLGHAARRSLARGDLTEALRAKQAKDTAESLLQCKDEELARRLLSAAGLHDEDSLLFTLARDFYLISRKKQIDLVERFAWDQA